MASSSKAIGRTKPASSSDSGRPKTYLDPADVVQAARDNGEPDLAEWLQREVDQTAASERRFEIRCWIGFCAVVLLICAAWSWAA